MQSLPPPRAVDLVIRELAASEAALMDEGRALAADVLACREAQVALADVARLKRLVPPEQM